MYPYSYFGIMPQTNLLTKHCTHQLCLPQLCSTYFSEFLRVYIVRQLVRQIRLEVDYCSLRLVKCRVYTSWVPLRPAYTTIIQITFIISTENRLNQLIIYMQSNWVHIYYTIFKKKHILYTLCEKSFYSKNRSANFCPQLPVRLN